MKVRKGHGTENDFVVVHDEHNELALSDKLVVALCDRRAGIGSDGLLRAVRTSALARTDPEVAALAPGSTWFMDYRNADASIAEMCGNGVRVLAQHLASNGDVDRAEPLMMGTRGGTKRVTFRADGWISVEMGTATLGRDDLVVTTEVGSGAATQVWMPNPHAVVLTDDLTLAGALVEPPRVTPDGAFPDGVNVEFVELHEPGFLTLRVHERGVGETRSCGTGVCAAVVAAEAAAQDRGWDLPALWVVEVPGGTLHVEFDRETLETTLSGPAVMVGDVLLEAAWLDAAR